ncbi:hypothetical protein ACFW1M_11610 [Streptomyces inhibens]|uniref:hypothetical protein n=1 Tax=Streptomyces inhibens TaxID=2293571 RepID=UPI0036A4E252
MSDTFDGKYHQRRTDTGRAVSAAAAMNAATYDRAPAPAATGCFITTLGLALATIATTLGVLLG